MISFVLPEARKVTIDYGSRHSSLRFGIRGLFWLVTGEIVPCLKTDNGIVGSTGLVLACFFNIIVTEQGIENNQKMSKQTNENGENVKLQTKKM